MSGLSRIEQQRLCDVVAGVPEAEDVLERAGVDYWFGGDETLSDACKAAHADPGEVASRLDACGCADGNPPPATLAELLRESDEQWLQRLAPAIDAGISAASLRECTATSRLLQKLKKLMEKHAATTRSLLPAADAIERGEPGVLHHETLRALRLDHLDLARVARDLRDYANTLPADKADLADALRAIVRETHHHLMVSYNFILPRVVTAAAARAVACEPW